jgi:hypothetical protein
MALEEFLAGDGSPANPEDLKFAASRFWELLASDSCSASGEDENSSWQKLKTLPGVEDRSLWGGSANFGRIRTGVVVILCCPCLDAAAMTGRFIRYETALLRASGLDEVTWRTGGYGFGR